MNAVKTYFLDVITKHYFDFNGRANRKQFWLYQLFFIIFYLTLFLFLGRSFVGFITLLILLPFLLDFKGPSYRKQFWLYQPCFFITLISIHLLLLFLGKNIADMVRFLLVFSISFPTWAIAVRRLHDINFRGWWVLLYLVPFLGSLVLLFLSSLGLLVLSNLVLFVGSLVLFVLWLLPGTEGKNRFN